MTVSCTIQDRSSSRQQLQACTHVLLPCLSPLVTDDVAQATTTTHIVNPHNVTEFIFRVEPYLQHGILDTQPAQREVEEKSLTKRSTLCNLHLHALVLQGTPEPQGEAEEKTPAAAIDKDGTPLPGAVDKDGKPLPDAADSMDLKVATSPKSKKAEPAYIPRELLKSKYHIQVCFDNALTPALAIWLFAHFSN